MLGLKLIHISKKDPRDDFTAPTPSEAVLKHMGKKNHIDLLGTENAATPK